MRNLISAAIVACGLLSAVLACSDTSIDKDADIDAFNTEQEAMWQAMADKIDADPSEAGVDAARKEFESRKASLKTKWDIVKAKKEDEVTSESGKKLSASAKKVQKVMGDCIDRNRSKLEDSGDAMGKLKQLVADIGDVISLSK